MKPEPTLDDKLYEYLRLFNRGEIDIEQVVTEIKILFK